MSENQSYQESATYPILATRQDVVVPGILVPLQVGRQTSLRAVDAAVSGDQHIVAIPQIDPATDEPESEDLHGVGVLCEVLQVSKPEDNRYQVTVRAIERRQIDEIVSGDQYMTARVSPFPSVYPPDPQELDRLAGEARRHLSAILSERADDPEKIREDLEEMDDPDDLVDLAAAHLDLDRDLQLELLAEEDVEKRLQLLTPALEHQREVVAAKAKIREELETEQSRSQREQVLRDRARQISEELGEADEDAEIDKLLSQVNESKMPDEARQAAKKQIARLRVTPSVSPEYTVAMTYIQWLLDIPWGEYSEGEVVVNRAREILDADHAGLEKVKKRILEFIAVRQLAPNKQGPILCLVGPPGVGKTSLGKSIAKSLGREYVRQSLGGVRDESEIRGHRRTYIGSLPGRVANGLKQAGTMNPVFVLDEIDKLAQGLRGDPAAALLEVLDPEQNVEFQDHYLEVPLDLSRVLFLATANQTDTIPAALLDRMEVIQIPGYTDEEKLEIGKSYLAPKQIEEHGLERDQVEFTDEAILDVIHRYTREAGVRNLEREIAAMCRAAAVRIAEDGKPGEPIRYTNQEVPEVLGPPRYTAAVAQRSPQIGVATALAWTPLGGEILFVEARRMPGKGKLELTGNVGDVMQESIQASLSWVRANAQRLEIAPELFMDSDLHVHVPEGSTPKDGPSAGVAIAVALASLASGRAVRPEVALTGELTLRGLVLPVGGIKGKVLAAHRAGTNVVVLPERSGKDLVEVPEDIREALDIRLVKTVDEALEIALLEERSEPRGTSAPPPPVHQQPPPSPMPV